MSWIIEKRYKELLALHNWVLKQQLLLVGEPTTALPPFPEAPIFDSRDIKEIAVERKKPLENYLNYLFSVPSIVNQNQFKIFFETYRTQTMTNKKVLIPLPERDFDLTQVAVLWKILKANGIKVEFASELGATSIVNPDHLKKPDLLNVSMFYPAFEPRRYFMELEKDPSFNSPVPFSEINANEYTGMVLIAGNTANVKHYLECKLLQSKVQDFWALKRPLGAIGQAVLIMVRTVDINAKHPLIHYKRTTCYPKLIEFVGKLNPFGSSSIYIETVEDEVIRQLSGPQFFNTSRDVFWDSLFDLNGFTCQDDWYLSARWEGDAYTFSTAFTKMILDCAFEYQPPPEETNSKESNE